MKTIQEMLQELSQCIVTVSGEFRFRTNWNGGKAPQPDLDVFDPNVPFCIENVGDAPVEIGLYNTGATAVRSNCKISTDLKTWSDYNIVLTNDDTSNDIGRILLQNKGDRIYIKADNTPLGEYPPYPYPHTQFKVFNQSESKKIRARGNIASLNKGADDAYKTNYLILKDIGNYCYHELFKNCTSLTQAPELPATTLANFCYSHMFSGCTSLTQAPKLPATILAERCYYSMFYGCTSLTQAPELPVTTLADNCYRSMFYGCTSLTQAPELPATALTSDCYHSMFDGCTSLTQAPELPATQLAIYCYDSMFYGCTSLTQAPELPATTLVVSCYSYMFYGCTSLTQAPKLPATTLANYCYRSMFYGCTSLTQAPELPATTLAPNCYNLMFDGCTKLNYIKCLATDTSAADCTKEWVRGVSSTGTFECDNKKYFTLNSPNGIPAGWSITEINPEVEKPDLDVFDPNVPFCIENVGDAQAIIKYKKNINIKISKDYKTWNDYTIADPITLDPTDRVYIKSDYVKDTRIDPSFIFKGDGIRLRARGNIASLIYGTNDAYVNKYTSTEEYCYYFMFYNSKSLIQAPELPATNLARYCYSSMFRGCASLTQAPELPATTLAYYCYGYMFSGCTSLTQAPELPATTLATACYTNMFFVCTNLNYVKCLATDISAEICTDYWLDNVSSTGDFYTPASTTWSSGISGIPAGWTRHDIT